MQTKRYKKLTLLHSNDLHGDFLAQQEENRLIGGVSLLSGYVNAIRNQEKNALYCIAGDMFRGSIIDAEYQGISTIEIMNLLAPDVVTIGNHEVDYGIAHLLFIEKCARFPIINANMKIKPSKTRLFSPYLKKKVNGMNVLFIGILTEETLSQTKNDGLIGTFIDISEACAEIGKICNAHNPEGIDLTVLITHIGFEEDKKLAAMLNPAWGVDIIIGGHSHTLPEKEEVINDIIIVQAGSGTHHIGRFDLTIDTKKNKIEEYIWQAIPVDDSHCPKDEELEKLIGSYKSETDQKYSRVITRFKKELTHPIREQETELGNLCADIMKDTLGLDIALFGSGAIRQDQMGPIVQLYDLIETFPYDEEEYLVYVTGKQFKEMIRFMLRDEVWEGVHCEFYQLSHGLNVTYSKKEHEFSQFLFEGEPIDEERIFTVGLSRYHYKNFSDFFNFPIEDIFENGKPRVISTSINQNIEEYFLEHNLLERNVEGRLIIE